MDTIGGTGIVWIIVLGGGGGAGRVTIVVLLIVLNTGTVSVVTEVRKIVTGSGCSGTVLVIIVVDTTLVGGRYSKLHEGLG